MEILSSIRALMDGRDKGDHLSLEIRQQATLNTPSVPLSGVGFDWTYDLGGGNGTVAGESISSQNAMSIVTVYACVRVISQAIASLPLCLKERTKNGSIDAQNHALYFILGTEPNPEMDRHRFWSAIVTALMLTGNAYAQIVRTKGTRDIVELYPLNPHVTEPYRLPNGVLSFRTQQGQNNGNWKTLDATDVCHFALLSTDGIKGMSPIHQAREALGLARAAEKTGARLFGNGGRPGGILTAPTDVTPEQKEQAKKSWQANHGGSNQGGTAVLEGDWKYEPLTLSPEDSQFIQVRQMQRTEVAALYGVPPNMVGDTQRLSNGNHENAQQSFVTDTLGPILSILEGELNRKVMPRNGCKAGALFAKFDLSERLRGDLESQQKFYTAGRQGGWFSANDVRRKLGENTINDPSADVYIFPVNYANTAQLPAQANTENINEAPVDDAGKDEDDPEKVTE